MALLPVGSTHIYCESVGAGVPIVFLHESCGCYKSWEAQLRFFSRRYRTIVFNARGYPPSDVPDAIGAYSQEIVAQDLYHLMHTLGVERAYVVGLSMGGGTALRFAIDHPDMVRGLVLASTGAGATNREQIMVMLERLANELASGRFGHEAEAFMRGPTRMRLKHKNPRAWEEVWQHFTGLSPLGLSLTFKGVVMARTPVNELAHELSLLQVPVLIMAGDEDSHCVEPSLLMHQYLPNSGLCIFPQCGHLLNLEEPEEFNRMILSFILDIESGMWSCQAHSHVRDDSDQCG